MKFKRIGKMQDTIIIGMLGGFIGTVCMEISNTLIYKAKKTEVVYPQITGQFFFSPKRVNRKENFILGEILHLGVGTFFGLPLILILKLTGKDHHLSKGLLTGMTTWGTLYVGGQKLGLFKQPVKSKTHYSSILNNALYGLTSAQAMVTLADPRIFASKHEFDEQPQAQLRTNYYGTNEIHQDDEQSVYQ